MSLPKTSDTAMWAINEERKSQIVDFNMDAAYDQEHNPNGELLLAAEALMKNDITLMPTHWDPVWVQKMMAKDEWGRLSIAGAFIAAEMDRKKFMVPLNNPENGAQ